jgi:hypothetical protein
MIWLQQLAELSVEAAEALPVCGCVELHQAVTSEKF